MPAAHKTHTDDPASFANIPAKHGLHFFEVISRKDPALHFFGASTSSEHVDDPPPFVNPSGHVIHIKARCTDLLPAGQSVHDADLAAKAYFPAGQSVHVTDLVTEAYFPAGQSEHDTDLTSGAYVPAVHALHNKRRQEEQW